MAKWFSSLAIGSFFLRLYSRFDLDLLGLGSFSFNYQLVDLQFSHNLVQYIHLLLSYYPLVLSMEFLTFFCHLNLIALKCQIQKLFPTKTEQLFLMMAWHGCLFEQFFDFLVFANLKKLSDPYLITNTSKTSLRINKGSNIGVSKSFIRPFYRLSRVFRASVFRTAFSEWFSLFQQISSKFELLFETNLFFLVHLDNLLQK